MIPSNAPEFFKIIDAVIAKSPFQKKRLEQYLSTMDTQFFTRAEEFAMDYGRYLAGQGIPVEYAVNAYLELCKSMLQYQIEFMKTGTYRATDHHQAFTEVYSSPRLMKPYMIALALSQFLWPTHYRIYLAFERSILDNATHIDSYLEIGPGHGLYLRQAVKYLKPGTDIHAVDISPVSIGITKSIINYFYPNVWNVIFWTGDILAYNAPRRYDFITMGEVLEHVNDPDRLLSRLSALLSDSGKAFVTTSINSPAVDHVYHFKSVEDVTRMIFDSGLAIISEQVLPVENLPMDEIISRRITINYCAEVKRAGSHA
jgi:2-polyprenyl-3-methyl-5-hydroxy-6-metoxy-1,4-benzoquinol methylase